MVSLRDILRLNNFAFSIVIFHFDILIFNLLCAISAKKT